MKYKSLLCLLLTVTFLFSCRKENDRTQWDVEVLGPVLYASLTLNELLADTIRQNNADGTVSLIVEQDFYNLEPDSIYKIPDTTITNIAVWPIFSTSIPAGFAFPNQDNKISLGLGSVQLTKAIVSHGTIDIELKNSLPEKLIYTYTIPKAKKNGIPFTLIQEVDAANGNGPGIYQGSFSLEGYTLDLTGVNGIQYNTIAYTLSAISDPTGNNFTINFNDVVIDLKSTLHELEASYVKGYLGQNSISENSTRSTGLASFIRGGYIQLDSVSLDLDIENYIGADAQIYLNSLVSRNNRTGGLVSLSAPSILQRNININRAQESGPPLSPVIPAVHNFHLDNSNSNLKTFVENLPEYIQYDVKLDMNPLGNTFSLYTDFLYREHLVNGKLSLKMPLRFAADNLLLVDTQDISLDGLTNLDPIGPLTLTFVASNGFPIDFDVQLFTLDENRTVTDSILIPGTISRANIDAQYKVTSSVITRIEIPVDEARKEHIRNSKFMGIRTKLNTPDYAQQIQLYSYYKLDLKLIANGTYYIR